MCGVVCVAFVPNVCAGVNVCEVCAFVCCVCVVCVCACVCVCVCVFVCVCVCDCGCVGDFRHHYFESPLFRKVVTQGTRASSHHFSTKW